jgi:hypothetical protein
MNYVVPLHSELFLGSAGQPITTNTGSVFLTITTSHINVSPLQGISHLLTAWKTPWKLQQEALDEKSAFSVSQKMFLSFISH